MRRPFKGDADNDGFISKAEANAFVSGKTTAVSGGKETNTYRKATTDRNGRSKSRGKTSKTPQGARTGGGQPRRSFSDLDASSDGQVQMAEFSSTWDDETLQKFRKIDTNEDGILSAAEWKNHSK